MIILITDSNLKVNPDNYDKVIYLGFTPNKQITENEIIVLNNEIYTLNNYKISTKGIKSNNSFASSKLDLERNPLEHNQICINTHNTNTDFNTEKGYHISLVKKYGHREIEI